MGVCEASMVNRRFRVPRVRGSARWPARATHARLGQNLRIVCTLTHRVPNSRGNTRVIQREGIGAARRRCGLKRSLDAPPMRASTQTALQDVPMMSLLAPVRSTPAFVPVKGSCSESEDCRRNVICLHASLRKSSRRVGKRQRRPGTRRRRRHHQIRTGPLTWIMCTRTREPGKA